MVSNIADCDVLIRLSCMRSVVWVLNTAQTRMSNSFADMPSEKLLMLNTTLFLVYHGSFPVWNIALSMLHLSSLRRSPVGRRVHARLMKPYLLPCWDMHVHVPWNYGLCCRETFVKGKGQMRTYLFPRTGNLRMLKAIIFENMMATVPPSFAQNM